MRAFGVFGVGSVDESAVDVDADWFESARRSSSHSDSGCGADIEILGPICSASRQTREARAAAEIPEAHRTQSPDLRQEEL